MGANSKIEWTDATWNPWTGCTKVSEACANCYMFDGMKRYGKDPTRVRRSAPPTFNLPLKKKRDGEFAIAPGSKVFTCSWSDFFHVDADAWRAEAWAIIRQRPDVTFQVLTKRIDRAAECLPSDWGEGYSNVWLGTTVENQEWADKRIPFLLQTPAAVRFLSSEPLLGDVDLTRWLYSDFDRYCRDDRFGIPLDARRDKIDWVIVGGESGHRPRAMLAEWVRSIRDQCVMAGVSFFFKQWGELQPVGQGPIRSVEPIAIDTVGRDLTNLPGLQSESDAYFYKLGKAVAGRRLDGREWSEFPKGAGV